VNFDDTPEETAFRAEVIAWLEAHAPRDAAGMSDENSMTITSHEAELRYNERCRDWQKVKYDHGWAGITWPKEYGGRGGTPIQDGIFRQEEAKRVSATGLFAVGIGMAGPTIIAHGTEAQKQRYLDPMLRGEEVWCQLFSEPGAGSDLGNLSTRADRDGDEFVVNGQKVWNSGAHISEWGILLVRTDFDAPKHRGITYLLVDMASPGIECRPIKQINGASHFNEVFLSDVRIPVDNVLGETNAGWGPMMTTLANERTLIGGAGGRYPFTDLVDLARRSGVDHDPVWRQQLARAYTEMEIQKYLGYRVKTAASKGIAPGPESSTMKLLLSEHLGFIGDLVTGMQGAAGMLSGDDAADRGRWQSAFLSQWASRIGGGTDQIQRNTVGEKVLGLPPEPRLDKGIPFRDIPK
jgi:alkylation response protein AidB-like acyl-CoA dehydrogenase